MNEHGDDQPLLQRLTDADPLQIDSAEFAAALQRLNQQIDRQIDSSPSDQVRLAPAADPGLSRSRTALGPSSRRLLWGLSAAALLVVGLAVSTWWSSTADGPKQQSHLPNPPTPDHSLVESSQTPSHPPASDHELRSPESELTEPAVATRQPRGLPREPIRSVEQLVGLSSSQLARLRGRYDWPALELELQTWLLQWQAADIEQKTALESTWAQRRTWWQTWTLHGLKTWEDPHVLSAGFRRLHRDLGPQAPAVLSFCLHRPETRWLALQHMAAALDDAQLITVLGEVDDPTSLHLIVAQLAARDSPAATEALTQLAADADCQFLLQQPDLKWNPQHWQRSLSALSTVDDPRQRRSVALLTTIADPQVDRFLLQKIRQNTHVLPAVAVLLLRQGDAAQAARNEAQHWATTRAVLPSAQSRVQKWQRLSHSESSIPNSLRKVCRSCDSSI